MIFLTIDEIIELHSKLIEKTGGCQGIRDKNLLESAIYSSMASFADTEIYPSIEEKILRFINPLPPILGGLGVSCYMQNCSQCEQFPI